MPNLDPPDLFAAAGIVLDAEPPLAKPKRARRPKPPTPAERAAAGRLEGARRSKGLLSPGQRARVGEPRDLGLAQVLAFPLALNVTAVAEMIERLPHGYAADLDKVRDQEVRRLKKHLLSNGLPPNVAWRCARELVHVAYMKRVKDAHKEAGVL